MLFHEQLSTLRRAKGISQEALAEQLGVSRQAVSKWETGTAKPELDNILSLCHILEVSPNELLGVPTNESSEESAVADTSPVTAASPDANVKQKSPVRTTLLYLGCIILLIVLGLGHRNTVDQGHAPKIESCYIHETRALENGREFTLKITYTFLPDDQPNEIFLSLQPHVQDIYKSEHEITTDGMVGYVTFLLPYGAECTVTHQSKAKKMIYQREILKITRCAADTYDQELLVK